MYLPVFVFQHLLFCFSFIRNYVSISFFLSLLIRVHENTHTESAGEPPTPTSLVLVPSNLVSFEKEASRTH